MTVQVQIDILTFLHFNTQVARVPLGERVRLSCVVRGNPRPTVEWRADGARIVPEADRGRRGMASHSVESEVAERAVSTHMDIVFHGD